MAQLEEIVPAEGIRYINFFNGRLLSGEDLSAERDAARALGRHLGQAIGDGVAFGLEVSKAPDSPLTDSQVLIKAGLAVNREGQVLRLQCDQVVSLAEPPDSAKVADCVFSDCTILEAGSTFSVEGVYVLTIASASQREGLAPISGLGNDPAPCNSKFYTEGVQFRLLPLTIASPPDAGHARNLVAYQCFGRPAVSTMDRLTDCLAGVSTRYGIETLVQSNRLTPSDVPLAVVWFHGSGFGFLDCWAVRRPLIRPAATRPWDYFTSERQLQEGVAVFMQFQTQVQEILDSAPRPTDLAAEDSFRFLPPLGVVPEATAGSKPGVDLATFFGAHASKDVAMLDASMLAPLTRASFCHEPIDLSTAGKLQIYRIWESVPAVSRNPSIQPTLVFASSSLPYRGTARFGFAQWGVSRVAPAVI
jgi:hypothetical protein